ncbi:two-component system response regulator [Thioalkalivibrio denitrificans]|uniref:Two-component system response regulator n=1 Tax=Thioalkalivibrio denitrificans TaxID=108003 RepID=A0A1V3NQM0_9GAMM|nr:GGDEF domain-containing response regulator [Thioalkalivibrio denitrificans]OOG27122.1 two-component system response regulator [Thioalkalivibrio denitrificans]
MDNLLRLIIIEPDLNDAEMMISTLKTAGFAVRPERAEDEEDLHEKLQKHAPDLVLCTLSPASDLTLEQVTTGIEQVGRHVPVIAIAEGDGHDIAECLEAGAHDLVRKDRPDHLKLVVKRAFEGQQQWRRLKSAESSLREAERRCKTLLDSSRDAIAYVHEGMHIYANQSYLDLFGYTDAEDLEGMPIMDMVDGSDQATMKEFLRNYDRDSEGTEAGKSVEIRLTGPGGEPFAAQMEFTPASIDGEPCTQVLIRSQANTKELEKQLNYLSQRDLVTGLYNRQYFMEQLGTTIGQATQGKAHASLVELRIDKFHEIRDLVGVAGSDLVLGDVAKVLENHAGNEEVVARFDGETFAILTPRHQPAEAKEYVGGILAAISGHICEVDGRSATCTASAGIARIDENAPDPNELLSRAAKACDEAARGDGNRVEVYQPRQGEMTQRQQDEVWVSRISEAVTAERLRLLFQPIVSLHGEAGEHYEVFMRMLDDDGQEISPSEFLPSAERTDMAKVLDRWVISHALKQLAAHRKNGHETTFFINLTAGSLQEPGMLPWIVERLKEHRVPAQCVVFEMKEATVVNHLKQAKEFVKGLKNVHSRFALEDFGVGLNPFQLMQHVQADFLKIDRSFMDKLSSSEENQESIRSITDSAHGMNKLVIAPHVEDATGLSILWGIGVNYIQGNFLQGPSEKMDYDFSSMS